MNINRTMTYRIENVTYVDAEMQLMELNNILDLSNNGYPIEIIINNIKVERVTLMSKKSLFIVHDFYY